MTRTPRSFTLTPATAAPLRKDPGAHKYAHGHALILSGGLGRSGAARLAARAALRIGAGLVTLVVPDAAIPEVASQITALMLRPLGPPDGGGAALRDLLTDRRISALCLGPGLGLSAREAELVDMALRDGRPCVLDADALTLLAQDEALRRKLHATCVLTPHEGEFARLCPDLAKGLDQPEARAAAVQAAAARLGAMVVLKGPATLVAGPDGRASIHPAAQDGSRAWLATAGSGDVLAGLVTGLLARALPPHQAADLAVALHAAAAARFGPGLIAEDLPDTLPAVLRDLAV